MSSPRCSTSVGSRTPLDHILALDGLRAIAVLMVMWFHLPRVCLPEWSATLIRALRPGYFGVDLFFVLSGFLITRILIDYRARGVPLRVFFIRRFLRIFPAYYFLIAVIAVTDPSWRLWCCAVYLGNLAWPPLLAPPSSLHHLWSLSVEEHFYLVWPSVIRFLKPTTAERFIWWAVLPIAVGTAVAFALVYDGEVAGAMIWENTLPRSFSLAAGGLMAFHERAMRSRPARGVLVALLVALVGGVSLAVGKPWLSGDGWYVLRLVAGGLFSAGIVAAVICMPASWGVARLMSTRPLRHIGQISYGLYLYHHPIYYYFLWSRGEQATPSLAAVTVGLSYLAALVSFHVLERPVLRLKDSWGRATRTRPPGDEPAAS